MGVNSKRAPAEFDPFRTLDATWKPWFTCQWPWAYNPLCLAAGAQECCWFTTALLLEMLFEPVHRPVQKQHHSDNENI